MRVACPSCKTNYNLDDARVPAGGAKLKCAKCQTTFPVSRGGGDAIPLPGSATGAQGGAVPLPGARGAPPPPPPSGAIPLPGAGFPSLSPAVPSAIPRWDQQETRIVPGSDAMAAGAIRTPSAVPLPGASPPPSSPFGDDDAGLFDHGTTSPSADALFDDFSISGPAPGDAPEEPGAVPLPGKGLFAPPPAAPPAPSFDASEWADPPPVDDGVVPLPGKGLFAPPPGAGTSGSGNTWEDVDASAFDTNAFDTEAADTHLAPPPAEIEDFPPPPPAHGASPPAASFDAAKYEEVEWDADSTRVADLPIPGDAFPAPSLDAEPSTAVRVAPIPDAAFRTFPQPPPPASRPPPPDFSDLPSPRSSPVTGSEDSVEFADADLLDAGGSGRSAAPEDWAAPSFDDLPSPVDASSPTVMEDSHLPTPAAPRSPLEDFDLLPSPAGEPSAAPDVAVDFGGVDFDAPSGGGAPADPLEFDPSGGPARDDGLEADLNQSLPPPIPQQNADGLEMLDFIDSAAASSGTAPAGSKPKRFHIRRRNGKVFGPFDEGVILEMLQEGQLLGNEDVSTDADAWTGIGTVPAFSAAIQKMLAAPREAGNRAAAPGAMADLKQKYETRMAARTTARSSTFSPIEFVKDRLGLVVGAAVLLLLLLAGLGMGFSRYGVFGHRKLFPATVRAGSPEAKALDTARTHLVADNFVSYKEARDAAAGVLKKRELPEARAVWAQAVFYLQRRYAAATPAEISLASGSLPDVLLLGEKHPEVVKARAGEALSQKRPDEAIALIQAALGRAPSKDVELLFLLSEGHLQKGQAKLAAEALKKALTQNNGAAKAHHALGELAQQGKDADGAAKEYQAALDADARHAQSAVELAAVELLLRKKPTEGLAALDRALDAKNQPVLGPAQLARAHALRGYALNLQFKPKEALVELEQAQKLDKSSAFIRLTLARTLLSQREYERALPLLKEISASEPDNFEATEGYVSALVALGKMNDALSSLTAASKRFPGNARLALLLGETNDALDKGRDAEQDYLRALNADPKLYEARLALARFYLRFRRTEDAKAQLDTAVAQAPAEATVHSALGELALQSGDFDKAKEEFAKTNELDPSLPDGPLGLARVALERQELDEAKKRVEEALGLDPHAKGGRLLLGTVLWRQGNLEGANAELEKAKKDDPRSNPVTTLLSAVKLEQGDLQGAEAGLMTVLSNSATDPDALFHLARVKNKRREHTGAIEAMRSALDRAPNRPLFQYEMGVILKDAGKPLEAIEAWKKAVALDPNLVDAWEALGLTYLDGAKVEEAIAAFTQGLKADPKRARLRSAIGDAHSQGAKWDQAIAAYTAALKEDPQLTGTYFKIGRAYTETNRHDQAIRWYEKAIETDSNNPLPYYHLGYAFKERGRRRDAVTAFKAYLARKPDAPDKKDIDDEIYDLEHLK